MHMNVRYYQPTLCNNLGASFLLILKIKVKCGIKKELIITSPYIFLLRPNFWPDNWTVIEWWRMHFWVRLLFFGCTFGFGCSNSFSSCFSLIQEIPSCSCNNNKQGNIYFIFLIVTSLDTMVEYFVDFHLFGVDSVLFHCAFVFECWNWYLPLKRHKRKRKTWK